MISAPTTDRSWPHPTVTRDLDALRAQAPLVQCITNVVVTNFTANVLLAIGASPAMVIAEEEVEAFAAVASAVLINVGTITHSYGPGTLAPAFLDSLASVDGDNRASTG